MIVKLLTEHHLEFLSLKGGCRGSSESTHVKMPHCWKSHALAHFIGLKQAKHGQHTNRANYQIFATILNLLIYLVHASRPLVKSAYQKNNFLISQPKHICCAY